MARRRRKSNPNEGWMTLVVVVLALLFALAFSFGNKVPGIYFIAPLVVALFIVVRFMYQSIHQHRKVLTQRNELHLLELSDVDNMSGLDFEKYVGELLRMQGYRVLFTPINDYGVDIIAIKGNIRVAVQTKRYSKPVGISAVQEVCAGMAQHQCTTAMVVTNNYFTPRAKNLAKSNQCTLVDRDKLAVWIAASKQEP